MGTSDRLRLDHLVYAAPDLTAALSELEGRLGVRPTPGGQHPGLGTRNALLALAADSYLEVIGPDPEQPDPVRSRPFGIDRLERPRLVTWAVKASGIEEVAATARRRGFDPGEILPMSRRTPHGELLGWRLTLRSVPAGDGLVPFLIDWGETASPAGTAAGGCRLLELRAEHPDPEPIRRQLDALGVGLAVEPAESARLLAVLETPLGRVVIA